MVDLMINVYMGAWFLAPYCSVELGFERPICAMESTGTVLVL